MSEMHITNALSISKRVCYTPEVTNTVEMLKIENKIIITGAIILKFYNLVLNLYSMVNKLY